MFYFFQSLEKNHTLFYLCKKNMTEKREFGNEGEAYARDYLLKQGYSILETNWQCGHLEVDVIAEKDGILVFVEVKTRTDTAVSEPQAAVNRQKQQNIIRAANAYILRNNFNCEARFDIITVVGKGAASVVEHLPDAYSPRW